jgi:hypothetical protein
MHLLAPDLAPIFGPNDQGRGPDLAPTGPLAPTGNCEQNGTTESAKNLNQNNETESSVSSKKEGNDKSDSLLAMTSEALQHVDKKKTRS